MSIDEEGFLGQNIEVIRKDLEKKYESFFSLCFELNKFVQKTKYEFKINNQNGQEVIVTCLLIKILNGFQSVVILVRYGLIADAKIIARSILEALFILKIACDDKNFITEYIKTDEKRRLKLMNIAHNYSGTMFEELRVYASKEIISDLKEKVDKEEIEDLVVEELAKRSGLKDHYDTAYRLLSDSVHATPRSLEEYITTDESENVTSFTCGPAEKDIDIVLLTSAKVLLMTLEFASKLFNVGKESEIKEFNNRLLKLWENQDGDNLFERKAVSGT